MKHPFTYRIRNLLIYTAIWGIIVIFSIGSMFLLSHLRFSIAVVDSLVFNTLFAILGIGLWYPVFYNTPQKNVFVNLVINHLSIMSLALAFWVSLGFFICSNIFPNDPDYLLALEKGIPWRVFAGTFFYLATVLIYYLLIYMNNLQEHIIAEGRLKERISEAELNALKSQINPHFLFNSLNSISSLTITNPEKAHEMIIKLAGFLRYSLSHNPNHLISLKQEIDNLEEYISVEKIRFGDKLIFTKQISDQCYTKKVPFLILQPLIENAIKHGVYESTVPVTLSITCKPNDDGSCQIIIENDFDSEAVPRKGTGTGLKNIRERLKIIYQMNDLMTIEKTNNFFKVSLVIPQNIAFKSTSDQ